MQPVVLLLCITTSKAEKLASALLVVMGSDVCVNLFEVDSKSDVSVVPPSTGSFACLALALVVVNGSYIKLSTRVVSINLGFHGLFTRPFIIADVS